VSASSVLLQLVRSHYRQDEAAFASSALSLARAAKSPLVRSTLLDLVRRGGDGRTRETREQRDRQPMPPTEAGGLLQALPPVSFADLLLEPGIQVMLDEIVQELEYREELAARKLRARNRLLFWGPPGDGKCLQIGTPVLRYDGSIVSVESVRTGDLLMGPDSKPRRVLGTTRGTGPLYRVIPTKGEPWVCNDVHVLTVVDTDSGRVSDVDMQSYLAASSWFRERSKLFTPEHGIEFAPGPELPIDPYFLGVWYGDGTKSRDARGALACVAVTKPDPEIRSLVESMAEKYGARVRVQEQSNGCPTFVITVGRSGNSRPNRLLDELRSVVGDGTSLPRAYLTASRADRAAFLAGLLDTDGTDNNGGFEIVQKVRGFADGICFLCRSLGLRATMREKIVNGATYWRVIISGECSKLPLRIVRKRAAPRKQIKRVNRTGFTVEPAGIGEYAGFELDGDGRFLLGDFTVTHNTSSASALASQIGVRAYAVSLPQVVGSHLGETGGNLGKLFGALRDDVLVVFDEIDALGSRRGVGEQACDKEMNSTVNTLLTLLDRNRSGIIIATTNRPDILDPALLRRFDEQIEFPAPSTEQMRSLAAKLCEGFGVPAVDVSGCRNFDEVTKRCETEARRAVMRELIAAEQAGEEDDAADAAE
jgi:hypothetical protein